MNRFARGVASVVAACSIVCLFGGLLVLLVTLILDPQLLQRTENVTKFVAGLVPGGAAAAVAVRGLRRRLRETHGNLSEALSGWLAGEPMLLAFVWVIVLVELGAFSYFVPVHAVRLEVTGDSLVPLTDVQAIARPGGVPLHRRVTDDGHVVFRSGHTFRWGANDTIAIDGGRLYESTSLTLPWSGLALFSLVSGNPVGPVTLRPQRARVTVRVTPAHAAVVIRRAGQRDTVVPAQAELEIRRGTVEVIASAAGRDTVDTMVLVTADMTVVLDLPRLAGALTLGAVNPGGDRLLDLEVIVDGQNRGEVLGQRLHLAPGAHRIRIEKCRSDGVKMTTGEFLVTVRSGVAQTFVKTVQASPC